MDIITLARFNSKRNFMSILGLSNTESVYKTTIVLMYFLFSTKIFDFVKNDYFRDFQLPLTFLFRFRKFHKYVFWSNLILQFISGVKRDFWATLLFDLSEIGKNRLKKIPFFGKFPIYLMTNTKQNSSVFPKNCNFLVFGLLLPLKL